MTEEVKSGYIYGSNYNYFSGRMLAVAYEHIP